jgi:hypothetical protein
MSEEERRLEAITKRFGGVFNLRGRAMQFPKPITLNNRAEALDMIFCLNNFYDWICDSNEPLEALKKFIEALPERHD